LPQGLCFARTRFTVARMSRFLVACLILASTQGPGGAAEADAVAGKLGETVTFVDVIREVVARPSGALFLNFGAAYPNEVLAAVIMPETLPRFPGAREWTGRRVRVSGEVGEHEGRRRIILRERGQSELAD